MSYLRDPAAIYRESFALIEAEADLSAVPVPLREVARRMIHACGMTDLAGDIVGDPALPEAVRAAVEAAQPVLCDSHMVRAGITPGALRPGSTPSVTLDDEQVPALARTLGTTRSAAAVGLWRDRLDHAVVLIGNAPTALFRLLELIEEGAPRPAAIIATPVGFVGAAESKALLIERSRGIPYLTVRGRRGGSAIAAAAFNAVTRAIAA